MAAMSHLWAIGHDDMERANQVHDEIARLGWDSGQAGRYLILLHEACALKPINQASNPGYNGDGAAGDLQDGQRLALASQNAEDVVLGGGSQAKFPQQPCEAYLKLIASSHDVQSGFFFRRLEGPFLLKFVLQLGIAHY
jgi:hypothetical protein